MIQPRFARWLLLGTLAGVAAGAGYVVGERRDSAIPEAPHGVAASQNPHASNVHTWRLPDSAGVERDFAQWRGQVLVLNFWATWCSPCIQEIAGFVELQHEYQDRGLQIVGVAFDEADAVATFARRRGVNYPMLLAPERGLALMAALGNDIGGLPFTAVFDREGRLLQIRKGPWTKAQAAAAVTPLLSLN